MFAVIIPLLILFHVRLQLLMRFVLIIISAVRFLCIGFDIRFMFSVSTISYLIVMFVLLCLFVGV